MSPSNNPNANYITHPDWDTTRKVRSRIDTIVIPYRHLFGHALAKDQQFWSMCGAHYHMSDSGPLQQKGELGQLLDEKLLTPNQYYGVDCNDGIIENNRKVYPSINWTFGDFKSVMAAHASAGLFNPAVINYDGVMGPKYGAPYVKSIMQLVDNNHRDNVLLVGNFVLRIPYRKAAQCSGFSVVHRLLQIYTPPDHWHLLPYYYTYKGGSTNRSRSIMGSFIFAKLGHSMKRTSGRRLDDLELK
jgi:hypothetical protein